MNFKYKKLKQFTTTTNNNNLKAKMIWLILEMQEQLEKAGLK